MSEEKKNVVDQNERRTLELQVDEIYMRIREVVADWLDSNQPVGMADISAYIYARHRISQATATIIASMCKRYHDDRVFRKLQDDFKDEFKISSRGRQSP